MSGRFATAKPRRIKASHRRRWKRASAHREYQHTDALGTPVLKTSASRIVVERSDYEPYGKLINHALENGPGYTGHVTDAATGLSYMQQRYYDPGVGRFLSVDPVTVDSAGGNFNRYWYANNNPYRFTDPDGRRPRGGGTLCSETSQCETGSFSNGDGGGGGESSASAASSAPRAAGPGSVFESRNQAQGEAEAYVTELDGGPIRSFLFGQPYVIQTMQLGSPNAFTYALVPVQTGTPPAVGIGSFRQVIFGAATHSFVRLEQAGLNSARAANVVGREAVRIRDVMTVGADVRGRMFINNVLIEYRMRLLPNGTINVGTIFPVR